MSQPPRATIREVTRPSTRAPGERRPAAANQPGVLRWDAVQRFLHRERRAFAYAFQGLEYAWRTQRHVRLHAAVAALVVGAGLLLGLAPGEWAALLAMIALVGALELMNTVVEVVVDLARPEYHPQAKIAKDVAAGAVLVAALGAIAVGVAIFGPHLLAHRS